MCWAAGGSGLEAGLQVECPASWQDAGVPAQSTDLRSPPPASPFSSGSFLVSLTHGTRLLLLRPRPPEDHAVA